MKYAEITLDNGATLLLKQLSNGNVDVLLQDSKSILTLAIIPITSKWGELI